MVKTEPSTYARIASRCKRALVDAASVANGYAVGAALLALWIAVRYPGRNHSIRTAFLFVCCAQVLLILCGRAMAAAESVAGPAVALLTVVLPLFTFAFWSGISLVRATLARRP
jgi:hypothetical protein